MPSHERDIILLIDDAPDTVRMISEALDDAGFTVLVATDGEVALDRLARITPDVILLDVCMPGLDGFETCRRIRKVPTAGNVPVLFMTGLAETEQIVEGLAAGGVDYLVKPVTPDELVARIRAHLRVSREHGSALRALELTGLALAYFSPSGQLLWSTPAAHELVNAVHARRLGEVVSGFFRSPDNLGNPDETDAQLAALNAARLDSASRAGMLLTLQDRLASSPHRMQYVALTGREIDVLEWVAKGKTNRDIGEILGMSPRTVNKHLEHIYEKLGVENRTAAVARFEGLQRPAERAG